MRNFSYDSKIINCGEKCELLSDDLKEMKFTVKNIPQIESENHFPFYFTDKKLSSLLITSKNVSLDTCIKLYYTVRNKPVLVQYNTNTAIQLKNYRNRGMNFDKNYENDNVQELCISDLTSTLTDKSTIRISSDLAKDDVVAIYLQKSDHDRKELPAKEKLFAVWSENTLIETVTDQWPLQIPNKLWDYSDGKLYFTGILFKYLKLN